MDLEVLNDLVSCMKAEQDPSNHSRLDYVASKFMTRTSNLFKRGLNHVHIDAFVVLLGELGSDVAATDWDAFKALVKSELDVNIIENQAAQSSNDGSTTTIMCLRAENATLKKTLDEKDSMIQLLQHDKRMLQQRVRRLATQAVQNQKVHQAEIDRLKDDLNASFQASRTSKRPKAWLTPAGSVAISLRRNLGNVACSLIGHVILADIAGCTVSRCEIKTGAALMSHSRSFFELLRHSFKSIRETKHTASRNIQMAIFAFREDATNSGIWRKSKLAAMEIESFFTSSIASMDQALSKGHHLRRLADVQRVGDGTGFGTTSLA